MNLEEYKRRLDRSHSFTGIPSYWEELQKMTEERDKWKALADGLYNCAEGTCPEECATGTWCPIDDYRKEVRNE